MTLIRYCPYRDIYLYVSFLRLLLNSMLMTCFDMLMSFCKGKILCTYSVSRGWIGLICYMLLDKRWNIVLNCSFWCYLLCKWQKWGYQVYFFYRFKEGALTTIFRWNGRYHIKLQSCASGSQNEAIMCWIWSYISNSRLIRYWSVLTDEGF